MGIRAGFIQRDISCHGNGDLPTLNLSNLPKNPTNLFRSFSLVLSRRQSTSSFYLSLSLSLSLSGFSKPSKLKDKKERKWNRERERKKNIKKKKERRERNRKSLGVICYS